LCTPQEKSQERHDDVNFSIARNHSVGFLGKAWSRMKDPKWIFPVVAAFLALSSLAHGILGWNAMSAELARTGASPDLLADLATGWYLGSVAMVAFAVIVLASWWEARGKRPAGRTAATTIAVMYFTFGLLAYLFRSLNAHFLIAFVIPGGLLGVAVIKSSWTASR